MLGGWKVRLVKKQLFLWVSFTHFMPLEKIYHCARTLNSYGI